VLGPIVPSSRSVKIAPIKRGLMGSKPLQNRIFEKCHYFLSILNRAITIPCTTEKCQFLCLAWPVAHLQAYVDVPQIRMVHYALAFRIRRLRRWLDRVVAVPHLLSPSRTTAMVPTTGTAAATAPPSLPHLPLSIPLECLSLALWWWRAQRPAPVQALFVVFHWLIVPNARSRSLGLRARLAMCITSAPTFPGNLSWFLSIFHLLGCGRTVQNNMLSEALVSTSTRH